MQPKPHFRNVLFRYWRERRLPERDLPDWWWQDGIYAMDSEFVRRDSGEKLKLTLDNGDELHIVAQVPCDLEGNISERDLWDVDDEVDEMVERMKPDGQLR